MTKFYIEGPFEVPLAPSVKVKMVAEDTADFWAAIPAVRGKRGCYVFALRAGRGFTPLYVGKTMRTFEAECFTDHKLKHYNYALVDYDKGTPVMFFVVYPPKAGKPNAAEVADLEDFLIQVGRRVNPDLRNIKGAKEPTWGIKGVIRSGQGKANAAEKDFRTVFKL